MSEPRHSVKDFLQRWSKRKHAASRMPDDRHLSHPEHENANPGVASQSAAAIAALDPARLPAIESITSLSDIREFLAPGVPEELTRAALRRVWVTDPAIRDFVGPAENQWDFTKPDGVPGFGLLEQLTPELRRMVASVFSDASGQSTTELPAVKEPLEETIESLAEPAPAAISSGPSETNSSAERSPDFVQSKEPSARPVNVIPRQERNRHGSAVPK
jgi:hypothetical protein